MTTSTKTGHLRVMIIEDNPLIALDLQLQIEDFGHVFAGRHARSSSVVEGVAATGPDVALVDLYLADGRTGALVVHELNKIGVPSIVVSGELRHHIELPEAIAVLEKPVDAGLLEAALEKVAQNLQAHSPNPTRDK
ncbi:response regulator [Salipiger marinus]|uniref:response regulator n=2 Tax=Salipiger marinus TaxID=555512 RepID=UPI0013F4E069|nr:response regulator [Salipiger marinus]